MCWVVRAHAQARLQAVPWEELSPLMLGQFLDVDGDGKVGGHDCVVLVRDLWMTLGDVLSGVCLSLTHSHSLSLLFFSEDSDRSVFLHVCGWGGCKTVP